MDKLVVKYGDVLAKMAMGAVKRSLHTTCVGPFHQPKVPAKVMALKGRI